MTPIDFLLFFLAVSSAAIYGYLEGRHAARCAAADEEQKGGAE